VILSVFVLQQYGASNGLFLIFRKESRIQQQEFGIEDMHISRSLLVFLDKHSLKLHRFFTRAIKKIHSHVFLIVILT